MKTGLEDLERRVMALESTRDQDAKVLAAVEEVKAEVQLLRDSMTTLVASAVRQVFGTVEETNKNPNVCKTGLRPKE